MWLKPIMSEAAIVELAREGVRKFAPDAELYIRPMYWAEHNGVARCPPTRSRPASVSRSTRRRCREPTGVSITRSGFAKPLAITMPIDAKAGCLYPNNARALIEARTRGFDNCLMFDMLGNVAELATANVFIAKDGVVMTPMANGSFLNGVTRQRVLHCCARWRGRARSDAEFADFDTADEIFVVGNFGKVTPVRRIDGRDLQPGPVLSPRARTLLGIRPLSMTAPNPIAGGDMTTRLTIRLDFEAGRRLGAGKVALLESIDRTGSISAAGRAQGMSYRRAWLLVDDLNQLFAAPLVVAHHGGANGGGAALTDQGRRIVALYRDAEAKMRSAAGAEIDAIERGLAPPARAPASQTTGLPDLEVTTSSRRGRTA